MRVNVGRGREIAVTEPLLYLLHRDTVGEQQTGTAVTKLVEAYAPQTTTVEQLGENRRYVVRFYQHSYLIYADVSKVVAAIAPAAQPPLLVLLVLEIEQPLFEERHQRQRPHAGFVFRPVGGNHHLFAVYAAGRHGMA